eukprot:XP_001702709.1 predicted protein [Chlamydomonas reinhardtii]
MAPGPGTRASYAAAASGAAPGGSSSSGVSSGSSRVAAAASGEQLLLALADSYELQVWRVPAVAAPGAGVGLQDRPQPQAGPQLAAPQPGRGQGSREPAPAPQAAAEGRESEAEGGALSQHQQHQRTLQPLVRAAAYPLPRHALIYSLAWIPAAAASTIGDGAAAAAACGAGAAAIAVADGGRGRGTGAGAAADGAGGSPQGEAHPVILAAGTHQGAIEWYAYEGGVTEGGNSSAGAAPVASTAASATGSAAVASASASAAGDSSSCRSDSLRLLKTTTCGSTQPLVDLHFLPPAAPSASQSPESLHSSAAGGRKSGRGAAATDGGAQFSAAAGLWGDAAAAGGSSSSSSMTVGRRGVLVGLQDASFALAGVGGVRNTIQLFDVGTMTHLASVVDPFESHEFVCCCPIAGAARAGSGGGLSVSVSAGIDPHVLVVGSVHGSFCTACYQYGLPSLCHHKARSATAALSTLDVRCGRRGLTQRFGLHHRSLYPRLATAREHYIFTSHAGTPLEVYDRRAMSSPLFSLAHLPRPTLGEAHAAARGGQAAAAAAAATSGATCSAAGAPAAWGGAGASSPRCGAGGTARPATCGAGGGGGGGGGAAAAARRQCGAARRRRRRGTAALGGGGEDSDTEDGEDAGLEDVEDVEDADGGEGPHEERDVAGHAPSRRGWSLGRPAGAAAGDQAGAGADGREDAHDEEEDKEMGPGAPLPAAGWVPGYAAAPHEHQGLWLEASEDVLLGRADNGAVFVWDLSTVLGWAAGPDRSGLWHYLSEYGSSGGGGGRNGEEVAAAVAEGVVREYGDGGTGPEGFGGCGEKEEEEDEQGNVQEEEQEEAEEEDAAGRQRRLQRHGMPACLGWVECSGTMPVASLSPGNPQALFTLGAEPSGREYLVASVIG